MEVIISLDIHSSETHGETNEIPLEKMEQECGKGRETNTAQLIRAAIKSP